MTVYLCFRPDHGHTIDDAQRFNAFDPEVAAEEYVERNFSDWDYPTEVCVHVVALPAEGAPPTSEQIFDVTVESVPSFSASPRSMTSGFAGEHVADTSTKGET